MAVYDESTSVDIPDRREQDLIHPSPTDVFYIISAPFIIVTASIFLATAFTILVVVLFLAGWIQTTYGRLYFYLGFVKPMGFAINHLQKGIVWEHEPTKRIRAHLRAPPITEALEINGIGNLAVVYNKKEKTDTLIVGGQGSDIAALVLPLQRAVDDRVTEVLKRIASGRDLQIHLSFISSRRPQDILTVIDNYDRTLHPHFVPDDPDIETAGREASEFSIELMDEDSAISSVGLLGDVEQLELLLEREVSWQRRKRVAEAIRDRIDDLICTRNVMTVTDELLEWARGTATSRMALAITIRRDHILNKMAVKGESLADDESEDPLILQIAQAAVDGLASCGVHESHYYDVREMHAHLRYGWDVLPDSEYNEWLAEHQGEEDYSEEGWDYFQWPQHHIGVEKRRRKRSACSTDESLHAVLLVSNFPKEAEPHTFRPLFLIDVPNVTATVTGLVVASGREVRSLDITTAATDPLRDSFGVVYETQQSIERAQRRQDRLEAAYRARYTFRFNMVFVISATNSFELERDVEEALRSIHAIDGVRVDRVNESYMLYPWTVRGTTGVPV